MSSVPALPSSNLAAWRHAFRLRTLPLAAACILLGSGLAGVQGGGSWRIGLLALLTTFLLQILANLANDYGDTLHGADGPLRIGPPRAMQQGWIQPAAMRRAIALCGFLAALSGAALLLLAWPVMADWGRWFWPLAGVLAIVAALAYTLGPRPYAYAGLGDVAVLVFFGLLGTLGSYALQAPATPQWPWLPALALGLLSVGVLNLNNLRDWQADAAAGKRTLVVRLGVRSGRRYQLLLLFGADALWALQASLQAGRWAWLALLLLPAHVRLWQRLNRLPEGELDAELPWLAKLALLQVGLFVFGAWLDSGIAF
jgi:1,4-dihydroxy-2-naphthoate octaprenyltransferase